MKKACFTLDGVPALLLGEKADKVYLFIHGQGGNKEEAEAFAALACPLGWQVLSIDLPQHGARRAEAEPFDPFHAVPELKKLMQYARARYQTIALRANSIGCWFSMLAFAGQPLAQCLFVSPLVDMENMIAGMMRLCGVSEARLEAENIIPTSFGEPLSWEYLCYARSHRITQWAAPTRILRAEKDERIEPQTVEAFAARFTCAVTVMPGGEHWFHTPPELRFLQDWELHALTANDTAVR